MRSTAMRVQLGHSTQKKQTNKRRNLQKIRVTVQSHWQYFSFTGPCVRESVVCSMTPHTFYWCESTWGLQAPEETCHMGDPSNRVSKKPFTRADGTELKPVRGRTVGSFKLGKSNTANMLSRTPAEKKLQLLGQSA